MTIATRLETLVPPPVVMLVVGAGMSLALLGEPAAGMAWRWGPAAAFSLGAGVFAFPAIAAFARAKTTINPVQVDRASTLVTTGVYRVSRNPMYVGLALLLCAWAAWLGRPLAVLGPCVFVIFINRFQIVPEERALAALFGAAYDEYRRVVRRWV